MNACFFALAILLPAQAGPELPGSVTSAPEWLRKEPAPFDVVRYFNAPPAERNAAPLYLDALFEFSAELASCFPEGDEREHRREVALARMKMLGDLQQALQKDPSSVSAESIDEAIGPYGEGFRLLGKAQRRDRCLFETGIDVTSLLPHAQAARQVGRVAALRVRRALERGDLEGALGDAEVVLRLARDLRPRGGIIVQLCSAALIQGVAKDILPPILSAPGMTASQCDRLLTTLRTLDDSTIDPYIEGVRFEYVMTRATLHALIHDQDKLVKAYNLPPGESIVKAVAQPMITAVLSNGGGAAAPRDEPPPFPDDADAGFARTSPEQLAAGVEALNAYYRALLALAKEPYAQRLASLPDPNRLMPGDDLMARVLRGLNPAVVAFTTSFGRTLAAVRGMECLILVRRWGLAREGLPPDLASAAGDAGLDAAPIDPFDGKPMRLVVPDAEPLVYSVGPDGTDEGGLKESKHSNQPGDLVFPLQPRGEPKR